MTGGRDALDDLAQKYGIRLETPQDKLDSYFEGLRLLRGRPGAETGEAAQWDAIGDQYMRMNEPELAKVAYNSALKALKRAVISAWFTVEERLEWERELLAKLDR